MAFLGVAATRRVSRAWLPLAAQARVDKANEEGETALYSACEKGDLSCARLLVAAKAAGTRVCVRQLVTLSKTVHVENRRGHEGND